MVFSNLVQSSASPTDTPSEPSSKYTILLNNDTTTDATFEDLVKVGEPGSTPNLLPTLLSSKTSHSSYARAEK